MIHFTARHGMVPARSTIRQFNDDAALYASDHDMFAFIMDPEKVIVDPTGNALRRGFIAGNSEVGAGSLWFLSFLFRDLCGNHIIWGAEGVVEVRLRHVGSIASRWAGAFAKIRSYMDGAGSLDEARMREMTVQIAGTKAEVLDKLFGIKSLGLSRKALEASYDAVRPDEDGDPRTVWGMAQGITRESQAQPFAEDRHAMDRAAGRLMQIAF
jgi:hypothetical protein